MRVSEIRVKQIHVNQGLGVLQKRKREEMLLILSNAPISKHYSLNIPVNKFSQNFMLRFM